METAIIVCLISSIGALVSNVTMFIIQRIASKSDKKKDKYDALNLRMNKLEDKIDVLTGSVNTIGSKLNETLELQDIVVQGLCWTIDGLEQRSIMNGEGKLILKKINDIYKQKGLESMKFKSLSSSKRSKK